MTPRARAAARLCLLTAALAAAAPPAFAHNLNVATVSIASQNDTAKTAQIQFDINWQKSWRFASGQRDAVWVFVKYSTDSGTTWSHATLKTAGTNPSGFVQGSGTSLNIVVSSDKKGAFLERSATGTGDVVTTGVQLVWDWNADSATGTAQVKVFGVEMVYIPTGNFSIGDGNGTSESVSAFHIGTGNSAVRITNVGVGNIRVDANAYDDDQLELSPGIGIDGDGGLDTDGSGTLDNATFPTGYSAFYSMKYEVSQGQYRDCLSHLTRVQQGKRVASDISGDAPVDAKVYVMPATTTVTNRNVIRCPASGNGTTAPIAFLTTESSIEKQDRACNYLSWMDLAAYADWAALRPLTELEFEKMTRGAAGPWLGQFAWGSPTGRTTATTISGPENGTETITNGTKWYSANVAFNNTTFSGGDASTGPLRCGIFGTLNSQRLQSGAGSYGNMELSGNVWEHLVTVGASGGRSFDGSHGDGAVTTTASYEGNATNTGWPGIDATTSRGVTGAAGSGLRGGSWLVTAAARLRISDRNNGAQNDASRASDYGGRVGRTA